MKIKRIIIVFLIFTGYVFPQNNINFGIKLNSFALHTEKLESIQNYENSFTFFLPRAGYLFIEGSLNKKAGIYADLQIGYLDANDYSGFELGVFLNKYISNKLYLQLGFNMHFNRQVTTTENGILHKSHSKPINFLSAGFGFDLTENFFIEANFGYALNNEYGVSTLYEPNYSSKPKNIYNIIKLGLGVNF